MIPTDLADYERRVELATTALNAFAELLISELDEQKGAFTWWSSYGNWKPLTLIADYLIQSVSGASAALVSASLAAKIHRESSYAESAAVTQAWRALAKTGVTNPHAFMAAIPRDAQARRRGATITQSEEHCFFHLGQTLDRLAAALIIVGGFNEDNVVEADWGTIDNRDGIVAELTGATTRKRGRVQPPGSAGLQLQMDLLAAARTADSYGTPEWLQWTRSTRNAMTHRSPATILNVVLGNLNKGIRLTHLFYRQPRWSELQSLTFGMPTGGTIFDAFIKRAREDVLGGLCDAMTRLLVALADAMDACWSARRSDPSVIVQPINQWSAVVPTEPLSNFEGFGQDLTEQLASVPFDALIVNDLWGKRWVAGRVLDDRRGEWTT